MAGAIVNAKANVQYCKCCYTLTDQEICPICKNPRRNQKLLWWWRIPGIWLLMRKLANTMGFIMCCMAPFLLMLGLARGYKLKELMQRLQSDVEEVIIATNSSLEGETTAMYISKLIKPTGIKVTRIAQRSTRWRRFGIHRRSNTSSGIGRQDGTLDSRFPYRELAIGRCKRWINTSLT